MSEAIKLDSQGRDLVDRVALVRGFSGLSQRQLAIAAGLTNSHVSKIERRIGRNFDHQTFVKIALAVGVSLDWLILGIGPDPEREHVRKSAEAAYAAYLERNALSQDDTGDTASDLDSDDTASDPPSSPRATTKSGSAA